MTSALALARRGLGSVWPNPSVGCVIVRGDHVVGRGWTRPGGRPHGETEALRRAGPAAAGATAYVSLEPCNHWGKTPPCTEALLAAGIRRAVIALEDPDPRVAGAGIARLRAAGVTVEVGLCADEAAELNAGFLLRVRSGRPLVALKLATTLDGRIATATGESQWITGKTARRRAHLLRAEYDAILVGSGTAQRDDPMLTCRIPGLEGRSPVRVVLDGGLALSPGGRLAGSARTVPVWAICRADADPARASALAAAGVVPIPVETGADGRPEIGAALQALGARGVTRVLAEGGGVVAASLLRAGLVDRLLWFRAPMLLGAAGLPAVSDLGLGRLLDARRWKRIATAEIGCDLLETYARQD